MSWFASKIKEMNISLLLAFSLCLSILSHTHFIPVTFVIFNFIVIIWFLSFSRTSPLHPVSLASRYPLLYQLSKFLFTLVLLVVLIAYYGFHFSQDIATVLFLSMLSLKLLEIRHTQDRRHISVIIFLQYFSLTVSFLSSQDIFLVIYNLLILSTLIFIQIQFTYLSSYENQIRNNSNDRKGVFSNNLKAQSRLILLAIPLSFFLFIFFPRFPGPLWTLPSLSKQGVTGLSDTMYPGSVNQLSESEEIVFTLKFTGEVPQADKLYWRGPILDKTDGFLWQQSHGHEKALASLKVAKEELIQYKGEAINYQINLEPQQQKWLFTLEMPSNIQSQSLNSPYLSKNMQYLVKYNIRQVVQYSASSYPNYQLNQVGSDIAKASLFPHNSNPKTYQLGQQWLKESEAQNFKSVTIKQQKIVDKALAYILDNEFYYSRSPKQMLRNPADQFLFEQRRGFCEHYASSFALLMRAAGIPARVVTGYQGMSYNSVGQYYFIRQANAHAWAEVWLDGKGWTRVDPTAVIPQHRIEADIFERRQDSLEFFNLNYADLGALQQNFINSSFHQLKKHYRQLQQSMDYLKYSWNQWMLGYDTKKQNSLLEWLGLANLKQALIIFLVLFSIVFAVSLIYFNAKFLKHKQQPLIKIYTKLQAKLRKNGLLFDSQYGPERMKQLSIQFFPDDKEKLIIIFDSYIRLRFTQYYNEHKADKEIKLLSRYVRKLF